MFCNYTPVAYWCFYARLLMFLSVWNCSLRCLEETVVLFSLALDIYSIINVHAYCLLVYTLKFWSHLWKLCVFTHQLKLLTMKITVRRTRGVGHLTLNLPDMWGYLNSIFGPGVANLTSKNQKSQMPGVCPGGDVNSINWLAHNFVSLLPLISYQLNKSLH